MSSPSLASAKRKRSFSQHHHPTAGISNPPSMEFLQPSSRDASGEDGEESTDPQNSPNKHKRPQSTPTPPSKRVRKVSDVRTHVSSNGDASVSSINNKKDSSEKQLQKQSSETKMAVDDDDDNNNNNNGDDVAEKKRFRSRLGLHIGTPNDSVVDDAYDAHEKEGIQPPAKGGLQDPVGYRTNPPPVGRPVRVYADGVFDLFHLGHMRQLEQAKKAFPEVYLLVGVTGDEDTHYRKGLTVLSGAERAETVRHCKWVDEVVPNCPWVVSPEFLDEHKIDYVAHDDLPYEAAEGDDIYAPIKAQGKFLVTQRTEGVSTTGVITRIVRDYDQYISRQFKRGASRQELNVSWLKKNELEIRRHVTELRDNIRNNWTTTGQELGRELRQLWQNSRPNSPAPSARNSMDYGASRPGLASPTAKSHLSRVEGSYRPDSPAGTGRNEDFATGYSLGLIGGVRAWMMRSRRSLFESNQHHSPSGSEEEQDHEPQNGNGESSAHAPSDFDTGANANSVSARQES